MRSIDACKLLVVSFAITLCMAGGAKAAQAEEQQAKGPYPGISPLVRVFTGDSQGNTGGINADAEPAKGSLQTSNIEVFYEWQSKVSGPVSQIQLHSSAPGRAYVRLYDSEGGRPGKLLAESAFTSETAGWQGSAFAAPAQAVAGHPYFISYAHEKDISDYVTLKEQRESVSFYWKDVTFADASALVSMLQTPMLTRVKAYEAQIKLEWSEPDQHDPQLMYEVYRNGTIVGTTASAFYVDQLAERPEPGVYAYSVRAVKAGQTPSEMSNVLSVTIKTPEAELPPPPVVGGEAEPGPVAPSDSGGAVTPPPVVGGGPDAGPVAPSDPGGAVTPPPVVGGEAEPGPVAPSDPGGAVTPPPVVGGGPDAGPVAPSDPGGAVTPPPADDGGSASPVPEAPTDPGPPSTAPPADSGAASSAQTGLPSAVRPETGESP